ncbi:hypothetical protein SAMN05428995_10751 [Loktanella sp. DSM 29012]|uniref:CPBP family intramembrane glutamic endopeptidase n=1 Tax=Loktanella sp. DSM 29012 TaxID=1881056 RepID=UPI0008C8EC5C|nr:CPBP family intramembrane glutamic endopeptidase [Loktanella sp. DSM 29012]SEQ73652.1 hypothetical protein SAMN05428995_10751 [Loktanella sp. DSM 29012]
MIWHRPYLAMAAFTAPARPAGSLLRIIAVLIIFEIAFAIMPHIYFSLLGPDADLSTPAATVLDFGMFILPAATLILAVRLLHQRGLASMIGPRKLAVRHTVVATLAVSLVLLVQEPALLWFDLSQDLGLRNPALWLVWLLPGIVAITLQCATEELLYRGYLQQQLGALSSSRWVWMVLPSVYFGFGHLYNGDTVAAGVLWAGWATLLGLACADLTARTGTLGAAVGLHVANNIFATVIIAEAQTPSSGLALLLYPYAGDLPPDDFGLIALLTPFTLFDIVVSIMGVLVMWLAARVALRV